MRVQHNIMAMNAYRNYNTNNTALSKNLEKLSSGYKINRAGDDAAGLAISEKMRAQITGLDVAQSNAQDGISLVQTAEGALTEVHDMLNRMYELADKSANGTYEYSDRNEMQKEIEQLRDEIDRISETANFNGIKLLDGTMGERTVEVGTGANGYTANGISSIKITGGGSGEPVTAAMTNMPISVALDAAGNVTVTLSSALTNQGFKIEAVRENADPAGNSAASSVGGHKSDGTALGATDDGYNKYGGTVTFKITVDRDATPTNPLNDKDAQFYEGMTITVKVDASQLGADGKPGGAYTAGTTTVTGIGESSGLQLQIGDTGEDGNQLNVSISNMDSSNLGLKSVDVRSQDDALKALDTIKKAIEQVSGVRGTLGATQNRLEHTINNLAVNEENIQNAESAIRDTDVADEMMAYTKNNILIQSAQAMLAQANQVPQGVLQLLQ